MSFCFFVFFRRRNETTPPPSPLTLPILSINASCSSSPGATSWMRSTNPFQSPRPSRRPTNGLASNRSSSSMCSPVPMNTMGAPVAATADSAPPPRAWPSILVRMTAPTSTDSRNAAAWSNAACPMEPSMTKMTRSGRTASATWWRGGREGRRADRPRAPLSHGPPSPTCRISSNRASSCLCRPEVSTMMTSRRSCLNLSTPALATAAGSVSAWLP